MESLKEFTNKLREVIDKQFDFSIEIDSMDITIWFSYELYESCDIPITYKMLENFAYFNLKKFMQRLKYNPYGFDSDEIGTMDILCKYLTDNKDIIKEIVNVMNKQK